MGGGLWATSCGVNVIYIYIYSYMYTYNCLMLYRNMYVIDNSLPSHVTDLLGPQTHNLTLAELNELKAGARTQAIRG